MHYCLQRQDLRSALSAISRLLREIRDTQARKKLAWSETETVMYIFKGHARSDGATPEGALVIDQAGNLYGTTGYGRTSRPRNKMLTRPRMGSLLHRVSHVL
jgi:hypothetical protein